VRSTSSGRPDELVGVWIDAAQFHACRVVWQRETGANADFQDLSLKRREQLTPQVIERVGWMGIWAMTS